MEPSAKYLLTDTLMEGRLADFLRDRRQDEDSWDTIARAVYIATGQKVAISGVTAQNWHLRHVGPDPLPADKETTQRVADEPAGDAA